MSAAGFLNWRREGQILTVKAGHAWWKSHAQVPTVVPLDDRLWRIFFCARNSANQSFIIAVDADPGDGMRIVAEHFDPVLALGPPGYFDHAGMGVCSALRIGGRIHLYYTGVALRRDVPVQTGIGLAVSEDGLTFKRAFDGPVLATGPLDPLFVLSGHVSAHSGGYRMWYVGGTAWRDTGGPPEMLYEIRTSTSSDGLFWDKQTAAVITLRPGIDAGAGRPFVVQTRSGPHLWYSRRGTDFRRPGPDAYHLVSVPLDSAGLVPAGPPEPVRFDGPPGPGDFDSWAQSYCCILPYRDDLIMIYNGDDFGRAGFGWARCEGGARQCL